MIPKSGYRFSEKVMLKQQAKAKWRFKVIPSRFVVACPDSVEFSREFHELATSLRRGNKRRERLANCGQDFLRRNVTHAAVMHEPTDRFVAWPAFDFAFCLDRRRKWIQWRPMPGAGRPKNSDGRSSHRGGDMQKPGIIRNRDRRCRERENRVAQIMTGKIARRRVADDFSDERLFLRSADHPYSKSLRDQSPPQGGIGVCQPVLQLTNRTRCEGDYRSFVGGQPALAPPDFNFHPRDVQLGHRPFARQLRGRRQRQGGAAIDHARQSSLAVAQVIEQREAHLTDESGTLRDSREKWRQGRFPGARHDQRAAIIFALEPPPQCPLVF